MRIGGVSGWLRAVPIAAAAGVEVSTHLYPELSAHLMRVTETAHWLEWQDWAYPILAEPFKLADSRLSIPMKPGCGIEWNEAAVKRLSYDI
jgi:mandelate racemase